MSEMRINEKISFFVSSDDPLSAEIGIIRENGIIWLYDVGNGENHIPESDDGLTSFYLIFIRIIPGA